MPFPQEILLLNESSIHSKVQLPNLAHQPEAGVERRDQLQAQRRKTWELVVLTD